MDFIIDANSSRKKCEGGGSSFPSSLFSVFAVLSIVLVLSLGGCASQEPARVEVPLVKDTVVTPPAQNTNVVQNTASANAEPAKCQEDAAVSALLGKANTVKSYSFDLAVLPDRGGSNSYSVRGNNVRVKTLKPNPVPKNYPDLVFLDVATKSAAGYCFKSGVCPDPNFPMPASYDDWATVLPTSWIEQAKCGKVVGTIQFSNRPSTRVRYAADGKYYEAYLDNFYGYPVRVAIATDADMTNVVGGYEYKNMAFNTLKDTDVVHVDK